MNDSTAKALSVMEDEGVTGIGIYASSGQAFQRLGDVPPVLPLSKLVRGRRSGQDSTLGIYLLDEDTNQIEYFRLSRLNVVLEMSNVPQPKGNEAMSELPDIIYIKFDGTSYFNSIRRAWILAIAGVFVMLGIFLVKKMMDDVAYCRENGENHLTIKKGW